MDANGKRFFLLKNHLQEEVEEQEGKEGGSHRGRSLMGMASIDDLGCNASQRMVYFPPGRK